MKNASLGFAIPYLYNGQMHDYMPDFSVRLKTEPIIHLVLETKGFDPLGDVKCAAADRWVAAVNADGIYGVSHGKEDDRGGRPDHFRCYRAGSAGG